MTDAEYISRIEKLISRSCGNADRRSIVQIMQHTTEKARRHGGSRHRVRVKHHDEATNSTSTSIDLTHCSLSRHKVLIGDCHIGTCLRGRCYSTTAPCKHSSKSLETPIKSTPALLQHVLEVELAVRCACMATLWSCHCNFWALSQGAQGESDVPCHAGFKDCLLPGMLCASLFPAIIGSAFPGAVYMMQDLKFRSPGLVRRSPPCTDAQLLSTAHSP